MEDDFKNKKQTRNPSVHGTVFFLITPFPLELLNLMMTQLTETKDLRHST